jgi:hypothetical protein
MCNLIQYILSLSNASVSMLVSTYVHMHSLRWSDGLLDHPIIHLQSLSSKKIILTNRTFGAERDLAPEAGNTRRCA